MLSERTLSEKVLQQLRGPPLWIIPKGYESPDAVPSAAASAPAAVTSAAASTSAAVPSVASASAAVPGASAFWEGRIAALEKARLQDADQIRKYQIELKRYAEDLAAARWSTWNNWWSTWNNWGAWGSWDSDQVAWRSVGTQASNTWEHDESE